MKCQRCDKEIELDSWETYITKDGSSNVPNFGPAVCYVDAYRYIYEHLPEGESMSPL